MLIYDFIAPGQQNQHYTINEALYTRKFIAYNFLQHWQSHPKVNIYEFHQHGLELAVS